MHLQALNRVHLLLMKPLIRDVMLLYLLLFQSGISSFYYTHFRRLIYYVIMFSVITLSYCGAAFSLNMMVPFDQIDKEASYPSAFKSVNWVFLVVTIGPILRYLE